jgi:Cu/Zn superoxide dismutase
MGERRRKSDSKDRPCHRIASVVAHITSARAVRNFCADGDANRNCRVTRDVTFQSDERYAQNAVPGSDCAACDNCTSVANAHGRTRLILVRPFKALAVAMVALGVVACSGVHFGVAHDTETDAKAKSTDYGQVASLRAIGGSAIFGKIRVIDRDRGANVLVSMMNVPPGDYRIAVHETPNCSSPNGFSAGPPWAPPGNDPRNLVPIQRVSSEDRVELSLRVRALHANGADGVAGRSVVVYAGSRVTDARPGVPNERMACGVFEPAHQLSF